MHRLRVLGPLEVDGTARVLGPRDRVVVSALALRPGDRVDADVLSEALWGHRPPASAAKVVQGCVSRLRQALGAEAIETVAGGYRLRADHLDVDRQQFEDLVERARQHLTTRTPERAIPLLTDALALWRGPAFGELEEWMPGQLEAVRLGQLRLAAEEDLLQARLDAGDHVGVATDGTVLTGQQPFRERRWALLALAQYRSGRQADALGSIRTARRTLGNELGLDPGSDLVALESAILAQDPTLAAVHEARLADDACPWKGLASYDSDDRDTFFGRAADIEACLTRLESSRLLVLAGPSGCGKSSLLHAGIVPALRRGGRVVEPITPGSHGSTAMAAARARVAGDPVIVIDQFEEAFTIGDTSPDTWLREIASYAAERAPVVIAVRADHLASLGGDEPLARLTEQGLHLVAPLQGDALREAVEGPARLAGLRLEAGLTDLLLRDAEDQPGTLPLLSHALAETWQRRESGVLTVEGYHASGGIRGAVAASAERVYEELDEGGRANLRWVMLRLVSLSDGGEPYRTPLPRDAATEPATRRLLDLLVRSRLVISHASGYELAHEALVRAWPRLRAWLDEDAAGQRIRRHLSTAASGWEALGRPGSELYRGARLEAAVEWIERNREALTRTERQFVEASLEAAAFERRGLLEQAQRQRVQNRRLRWLVAAAAALLVASTVAAGSALNRGREAERGRDAAATSAATARHESVVARSFALRSTSKQVAALMAVQAWKERPDVLAESALLANLTSDPGFLGYRSIKLVADFPLPAAAADVPHGDGSVLVAAGSSVALADPLTGKFSSAPFSRRGADSLQTSVLRVSADGSRAVQLLTTSTDPRCVERSAGVAGGCTAFIVYDLAERATIMGPLATPFRGADVAISRDGSLVAVAGGRRGEVATWDVRTGRLLAHSDGLATLPDLRGTEIGGATAAVAFGRGDLLYVGRVAGALREVSARSMRVRRTWPAPGLMTNRQILVIRGDRLIAGGDRGQLAVDLRADRLLWVTGGATSDVRGCHQLAVSTRLGASYCATDTGQVVERELDTGQRAGRLLEPQLAELGSLVVTGRGSILLAFSGEDAGFARWSLDGPRLAGALLLPGRVATGGYDLTGRLLLVSRPRGGASEVVDADTGASVLRLPVPGQAVWLSADMVGVVGRRPVLVDVASGDVRETSLKGSTEALYPEPGGSHAWAVARRGPTYKVRRVSLSTGEVTTSIALNGIRAVRLVSDGTSLFVTSKGPQGNWGTWRYDVRTGARLDFGSINGSRVSIAPDHSFLAGNETGQMREYGNFYFGPSAAFPPVRSAPSSIQIAADGSRLLVTTPDQTVQLYDVESRASIGEPIATQAPAGAIEGWLRPDGRALVINTRYGVEKWDLGPGVMLAATCELAGRNWTRTEWSTYVGSAPYRTNCAQFGIPGADEQHPVD